MTDSPIARRERPSDVSSGDLTYFVDLGPPLGNFRQDVIEGLSRKPRRLLPKYFYDAHGSHLFDLICETQEYYVTRTELALLADIGPELAERVGEGASVIEYGAGSQVKIRLLMDALPGPARYLALDISREHLLAAASDLATDYPHLEISAVCADFTNPLRLPDEVWAWLGTSLAFLPGSTIGNFEPDDAVKILRSIHAHVGEGGKLLIGIDLLKDVARLEAAYNDAAGHTAAFNLNLLRRIKAELDGALSMGDFRHRAFFNPDRSRVEMHLEAVRPTQIALDSQVFDFEKGETVHTECSHKYTVQGFRDLAARAGFQPEAVWTDDEDLFSLHLLRAA